MIKERTRYIVIRFISSSLMNERDAWKAVSSEIRKLYGVYGAARVGLYLSYYDFDLQTGIFRSSHNCIPHVRVGLCYIHNYNNRYLYAFSDYVSGTLKKCKEYLKNTKSQIIYSNLRQLLLTQEKPLKHNDESY